jgi:cobalt-zinc-cadmium efflux system membrane fusion protein
VRIELPSTGAVDKVGLRVALARTRPLTHTVTAPGMVDYDPGLYARLTARASGAVWRVYKEIGDPIRKGEVLALIDAREVGKAKADFLTSLTQFQLRDQTLKSMRAAGSSVPAQSLRMAASAQREARIRLFNDRQALLNLGFSVRIADLADLSDDSRIRFVRLLGLPDEVRRGLDPDTLTANLLPLTAPFDGQVVERLAAAGEVVQTTQPKTLFVVADVSRLHIDLDVSPEDMAGVRVGQPVTFRPNDGGREAAGRVSHISPEVNAKTRRVQVHAEVPNKDGRLRPNTFGTGQIVVARRPGAVVVPAEAVQSDGRGNLVFVRVSATAFEARPVRPGLRRGGLVEVSGVRQGEEVVTAGSHLLRSELQKGGIAGGDD